MIISARQTKTVVKYKDYSMEYHPDGNYSILKDGDAITSGKYDSVIATSYNEMDEDKRNENLTMDLESWQKKAIEHQVVP